MYSLAELSANIVKELDELFNVNIQHLVTNFYADSSCDNACSIKLVTFTNSDTPIIISLLKNADSITVITNINSQNAQLLTDYNILDLKEMTTLIVLTIKSSFISYCHVRGI